MRKELLKMGLIVGLSTSLFGFTYELKDGWQQLGAVNDIDDLSVFNNQCIDYLWYYDNSGDTPEWRLHIANGNTYDYCGNSLESLKKGQGFWAKANGSCSITVGTDTNNNDCDSNMPAPPDLDKPECITCDTGIDIGNNTINGDTNGIWSSLASRYGEFSEYNHVGNGHHAFQISLKTSKFNVIDTDFTIKIIFSSELYFEFKGKDQYHTPTLLESRFVFNKININGTIYDTTISDDTLTSILNPYVNSLITKSNRYFKPYKGQESLTIELTGIELN